TASAPYQHLPRSPMGSCKYQMATPGRRTLAARGQSIGSRTAARIRHLGGLPLCDHYVVEVGSDVSTRTLRDGPAERHNEPHNAIYFVLRALFVGVYVVLHVEL